MDKKLAESIQLPYETRNEDFGISASELAAEKRCSLRQAKNLLFALEQRGVLKSKLMVWQGRIARIYYKEAANELQVQRQGRGKRQANPPLP